MELHLEQYRLRKQRELGQFFTPKTVADFMASLLNTPWRELELLDAGAGTGALTAALVRRLCEGRYKPKRVSVTAYEIDSVLIEPLRITFAQCQQDCERVGISFTATVFNEDFISAVVPMVRGDLFASKPWHFNTAIVNPPYRKVRSDSSTRLMLRSAGIETGNLYTGFIGLVIKLLTEGGELVTITPRSFCNGPYFKRFRADFLETMALRRLHVYESRSATFSEDDVLQENVIVHAVKGGPRPKRVILSSSSGPGSLAIEREVAYHDVVSPSDPEQFIHVGVDDVHTRAKTRMSSLSTTLAALGLNVSTGRVVDFRVKFFLRQHPGDDTIPLIYPCHFNGGFVCWPKDNSRKPNAILSHEGIRELLVPAGIYVLVKRFTTKEERRRVVACIYDPDRVDAPSVGFENHLNYYHTQGHGLSMALAKGLAAFLNSTIVDMYFRQFSGHTQVNATDLRMLNYPTGAALERLGHKVDDPRMPQEELDHLVEEEIF